ncbi:DNA topoisomerase 2 [Taphrina deformans PYCC 5710]|uniref:DNA topoisomerase 2 n=1 Tax=Taphrina deformans (strain PYCC 5710 / ATCC 11124 / CBS 356.35 / IMI 108563 / JCM 9778 / NBRC 8474) TaxID=1097556 RepID=R4X883_TAPDE|nr:DNA topoisomerase 2 [Taphrina deformans PYCC 5710]|eukprot:CCG81723.1 DNA topoisomerase 2 [Taphrina deformans PYCC 5710]
MSSAGSDYENYEPSPAVKKKVANLKRAKKVMDSDEESFQSPRPVAKKARIATTAKTTRAISTPLADVDPNHMMSDDSDAEQGVSSKTSAKKATKASDNYQKLTQLEHVIKRPDTYIGSIESQQNEMWSYVPEKSAMEFKKISLVPGLFKIYDEILVNAADNKERDQNMDTLKVDFDRATNTITVMNNGHGIPVEMHEKEGVYIPELIFGHLLTSSNYDDDKKKTTGGRNGYGAKLANIFSTEFTLETTDQKNGKKYVQTWTQNMSKMSKPKITSWKSAEYTKITFKPDLQKFGMLEMDDDLEGIFQRRVYDLAGCVPGIKVFLNGERIKIKTFKEYANMYIASLPPAEKPPPLIYERVNDRWEVAFTISEGQFNQVSFVNSIATTKGGTHVNYIADQIVKRIIEEYAKKNKKASALKAFQVKQHIWLFVNCKIENPAFDSQTKETLTLKASQFGSKCNLGDDFMKKVLKSGVLDDITRQSEMRADKAMKKTDGAKRTRITGMAKLEDANKAGTREAERCTLILTEGDSAKTLAISGMSVVGRDHFGVFPLRGKLLNVRDAAANQVSANTEIQNIKQILGLKHGVKYKDAKELRYGHLMIMTDQDHDGSHIKGLIINYLECFYPSLLSIPGFLIEFITPIVRCTKGKEVVSFFTIPEYEAWKEDVQPGKEWKIKYFKGLGTSDTADAKKYFSDLDKHLKEFHTLQDGDQDLISLAFSKHRADDRKEWLRKFVPGTYMDHSMTKIPFKNFINDELILFSMADNIRSIPNVMDGFKPGQRKILFACFKRKLKAEIKVAQLVGYVGEHTAYHHGEQSLSQTIVGLAQSFVGSNNINILMPNGQFGTRHSGGKDAASARYIFTDIAKIARKIFVEPDSPLLNYLNDDGLMVEPQWFAPILPMILVNGAQGIGTGWSTSIPNFNPADLVRNIRKLMDGEEIKPMEPWYRGFQGLIEEDPKQKGYRAQGIVHEIDDTTVEITELPLGFWTLDMKEFLEQAIAGTDKSPPWVKDYADNSTESRIHFTITLTDKSMKDALHTGLLEKFKLTKNISMQNLVAFDPDGRIRKYNSAEEILKEFYHIRLQFYQRRKDWMAADLEKQYDRLSNQARFVQMIINKELSVSNKKRAALVDELKALKFTPFPTKKTAQVAGETEESLEDDAEENAEKHSDHGYDYLLGMAIWSLTRERVEKLLKDRAHKEEELNSLLKRSAKDLWKSDLDDFELEWQKLLENDEALASKTDTIRKKAKGTKLAGKSKAPAKRKKAGSDDDASDDDFTPVKKRLPEVKKEKPRATKLHDDKIEVKDEPSPEILPPKKVTALKQAKLKLESQTKKILQTDDSPVALLSDKSDKSHTLSADSDEDDVYNFVAKTAATKKTAGQEKKNLPKTVPIRRDDSDSDDWMAKFTEPKPKSTITRVPQIQTSTLESEDEAPAASVSKEVAAPEADHGAKRTMATKKTSRPPASSKSQVTEKSKNDHAKPVPAVVKRPGRAAANARKVVVESDDDVEADQDSDVSIDAGDVSEDFFDDDED